MASHVSVTFDPLGGPLSAVASSGGANPGAYQLLLFAPDQLTLVREFAGRFATPAAHDLGAPHPLDGRLLHLLASVANLGADGAYAVSLTVRQNGRVIAEAAEAGVVSTETKELDLFIALRAGEPFAAATASAATESIHWRRAPFIGGAPRFAALREAARADRR